MKKEPLYYAVFHLPKRDTQEGAHADHDRLVSVLAEHAPDLLPPALRPAPKIPGEAARLKRALG